MIYEKDILNNMKFVDVMANNVISQPWLLNYELTPVDIGGETGTVYSFHGEDDGKYYVRPSIMEDPDNPGNLKFYEDNFWDEARKRGYGIEFESEKEAENFSKWLSKYHDLTAKKQQSYELER